MGAFTAKKTIYGYTAQIPYVAEQLCQSFSTEGYEVRIENTTVKRDIIYHQVACLRRR